MNNQPIGMFDSGVGGLTVFSEIVKELPNEDIIYLGDTKNFPYGSKSKEAIIELSKKCVEFLISKNVKVIIIACGTATSQSLETLQKIYNIPIIGIIEPTIQSIKNEGNLKKIGIIATQGTIKSKAWEKNILEKISNVKVQSKACSLLAPMAEEGWTNNEVAYYTIKEYVKDFKYIDKLILGCTHYPLFKELIAKELGDKVDIVNTGEKLAKYLNEYITTKNIQNLNKKVPEYELYLTDTECNFINVAKKLLQTDNINIEKANI